MSTTTERTAPEQRTITADVEDVRTEGRILRGFAALYGQESRDLGGYTETIAPGAFRDVLASDPDVILSFNHSPDRVLARTSSGTLRLQDDEQRGLAFEADLGDGPTAQDVRDMVRRGDVRGASFRFVVAPDGERWEGEKRTLTRIGELIDLSLATTPAYDGPRVELRSAPESTTENTNGPEGQQEEPMSEDRNTAPVAEQTEDRTEGGGLAVEDRAQEPEQRTVEQRVLDGLRSVRKGEARSLTTTSADPVAPPELSSFLFDKLRASSIALQSGIRVIPTDRESIQWPQLTADVAPDWYAETDTITPGDPSFATLTATPKKLAHIVELSNEVIDDSEPSILDVLNGHLAAMLGLKLDLSIFEGNPGGGNANSIEGLKYVSGIQSISMGDPDGAALTNYDPFLDAVGLLRSANVPGPYAVAFHPRTATELSLRKDTDGNQLSPPREMPPVFVSSQLSITETKGASSDASSAYVYAPSQLVLVRRQDAALELDRSRLFNQDMSELRGKLRADLLVPNPEAVVRIEGIVPA